MQRPFAITPAVREVELDDARHGEIVFTVTNDLGREVTAIAELALVPPADAGWAELVPGRVELEPRGTHTFVAHLRVDPAAEPGTHRLRLVVADEADPDTVYSESADIAFRFTNPAVRPPRPFPWWIVYLVGAILLVVGLVAATIALWPEYDPADDALAVSVDPGQVAVPQGRSVTVDLTLTRGPKLRQPVMIEARGLPDGVIADPLTVRRRGLQGTLVLTADRAAPLTPPQPVPLVATGGPTTVTQTLRVEVVPPPIGLVAGFKATPMAGPVPLTVQFTDESNDATRYEWTFGDRTGSREASPSHTYHTPGEYLVTQRVLNDDNELDETSRLVRAEKPPLVAQFAAAPSSGAAPLTVRFQDQSKQATQWLYEFGDGASATTPNPTHTFGRPGRYGVTLTVTNADGSARATQTVTVGPATLTATLSARPVHGTLELQASASVSGGTASAYQWDLGDGTTKGGAQISHTYQGIGTYQVRVTARDAHGNTATATQPVQITAVVCDWDGARWLSHGWDSGPAWQHGVWVSCAGGIVTDVSWTGTVNQTASPSGTSDPAVGCNWRGARHVSTGIDGGAAFDSGVRATCSGGTVTRLAWSGGVHPSERSATPGELSCNWNGARWLTHGWDGGCAWQTGVAMTCDGSRLTHVQWVEDPNPCANQR